VGDGTNVQTAWRTHSQLTTGQESGAEGNHRVGMTN